MSKISVYLLSAAIGFSVGTASTSFVYRDKIAKMELDAAVERAEQGKRDYERIIEAQNGLDAWRATADSLSAELDRVRKQKRQVRASADTCRVERDAVTRCEGLLGESLELLREGSNLSERNAAIHDALAGSMR